MTHCRQRFDFQAVRAPGEPGGGDTPTPPAGTVTFLFTDIEGSTGRWEQDDAAMRTAHARHDALLRRAIEAAGGYVFKTVGDGFCAAFSRAADAVRVACDIQRALPAEAGDLPVRMALHCGSAEVREGDYFGLALSVAARLRDAAHGGQVLLSQTAADLARDMAPPDCGLRELGSYPLRGVARAELVYQLLHPDLPADFPPLRLQALRSDNLPQQLTAFVGREAEAAAVAHALEIARLVTLTGTGGVGKTRLSLEVAAAQRDRHPDGVWLVELDALSSPALVAGAIAAVLGVKEEPGRPLADTLADALRPRTLLLVLDNCEHLVEACARLAERLLRHCPGLHILASSREALEVNGESTYPVPPMALPDPRRLPADPQDLLGCDAVRLFVDRATSVLPSFALTARSAPWLAEICVRLDGLPLAIVLAAARVRSLSPEQIAQGLKSCVRLLTGGSRTVPQRQQTLEAAMNWSYDLLTDPERTLLARLSVFAGGWTLPAAEAVCTGDGLEDWEIMDLVGGLVNKSLVTAQEREEQLRYRLLEPIRQYAAGKLRGGEAEAMRGRHATHFLVFAETADVTGREQAAWLARLEAEHDNLRAAMEELLAAPEGVGALRLGAALYRFWAVRGYPAEGRGWLTQALARPTPPEARALRGKALAAAGGLAWLQCDYPAARSLFEESLTLRQSLGDRAGVADTLNNLGQIASEQGRPDEARALLEQSLTLQRDLGDREGMAYSLGNLGLLALAEGDDARARQLFTEGLALDRAAEDLWGIANSLDGLGRVACRMGDSAEARRLLTESLSLRRQLADRTGIAESLESFAALAVSEGRCEAAAQLWGAADARRDEAGAALPASARAAYDGAITGVCDSLGEPAFARCRAAGRLLTDDQATALALDDAPPPEGPPP